VEKVKAGRDAGKCQVYSKYRANRSKGRGRNKDGQVVEGPKRMGEKMKGE
jgi:hypothetical protein